jgi:hypothetical protein
MNLRVILLVFIIFIFAVGFGVMSYSESLGIPLKQAYDNGKVTVVQNTTAGTVPHVVTIKNNDTKPVKVQKGDILKSNSSQDLVIAENSNIPENSTENINAYCFEPTQQAVVGAKLQPSSNTASSQIKQIITDSNPSDIQNATSAQLQIWTVVSGGNLTIYSGEPAALVDKQGITFFKLRQELTDAKSSVMSMFNVTSDGLENLTQQSTTTSSGDVQSLFNGFIDWIKGSLGI